MKAEDIKMADVEIELLKNKKLCKVFAKEKSLEDYYLEKCIEERRQVFEFSKNIKELKKELKDVQEKLQQASKPLEQRVSELEKEMKQVFNLLSGLDSRTSGLVLLK